MKTKTRTQKIVTCGKPTQSGPCVLHAPHDRKCASYKTLTAPPMVTVKLFSLDFPEEFLEECTVEAANVEIAEHNLLARWESKGTDEQVMRLYCESLPVPR